MTRRKRKRIVDKDRLPLVGRVIDLLYPTVLCFLITIILIFATIMDPSSPYLNYGIITLCIGFVLLIIDYLR